MDEIVDVKWTQETDLTDIFAELGDDCSISVERKEPEWCSGHIRRVHFNPDEPISLDWISKKFGGEKLMIRVFGPKTKQNKSGYLAARTVDIMGPPRDGHGTEMTQGPDGKACRVTELSTVIDRHNQKMGIKQREEAVKLAPQTPSPALQNESLFATMIQSQATQHAAMMQMMGERVNSLEGLLYKRGAEQQGPPMNPIDQIKQTAEAMNLLKSMSGEYADGGSNDDDSIISMIGPIVQGMFAAKNNPQQTPRGVLKSPLPARVIEGPQKNEPESLRTIANNLSSLSADEAAQVVFTAMGSMPADKREHAMKAFMTRGANMDSELDDSLNRVDTNSQYVDELPDPFAIPESDPLPGPGGEHGENAPNDQVDRPGNKEGI